MNRRICLVISTPLLAAMLILAVHFIPAYADVYSGHTTIKSYPNNMKSNILAVEYSQACQTMLDHNATTSCPTLDKIWKYDTTNTQISGKLSLKDGVYYRTIPQVRNHYIWYGNMTVCVACSVPLYGHIVQELFIAPSDFTYVDKDQQLKNAINYTIHTNPYISPDCQSATVGYTDLILADTIHYMLNQCVGTHLQNNQTKPLKQTPFDFNNPYSTLKYQKFIQQMKSVKVQNCINFKCNQTDPYKNKNWGK